MSTRCSRSRVGAARAAALSFFLPSALLVLAPFAPFERDEPWSIELAEVAPHAALALSPFAGVDAIDCSRCHAEIAAEWAETQHAHAWIDPLFQAAIAEKRRPESCTGCHVPLPLLADELDFGRKPLPREDRDEPRGHGITCRSCHEGPGGAMHGPYPVAGEGESEGAVSTQAHASVRDERFIESGSDALCAACHRTTIGPVIGIAKDYELARLGERGMSCVDCHMRRVERPIASDPDAPDGAPGYPVRAGRSHALQTPRDPGFLAAAFELEARVDADGALLRIKNRAGHRVPGLVDRKLVFRVEARDAAGAVVATAEHTLDTAAYLPLEGSVDVRIQGPAATLRVTGDHHAPGSEEALPFLERVLAVP